MKGGFSLLVGGGGGDGCSNGSSTVEVVEVTDQASSSYPVESEIELGLGLSLDSGCGGGGGGGGGSGKNIKASGGWGECGRILTAKDFPSVVSHGRRGVSIGTKRAADSVSQDGTGSPPNVSQVVGWPPIGSHRMSSLVTQAKTPRGEEDKPSVEKEKHKDGSKKKIQSGNGKGHLGFVKVNMDGIPIGRKVDLSAHTCYLTLAQALEDMFCFRSSSISSIGLSLEKEQAKGSRLLDGSSEFVLTYEDKEGDWMLVGDVPWRMFLSSVKRLRIMKTSETNGLGSRFQERNEKQRSKLV